MKNITVLGIDLAKDVFQLHGVNEQGNKGGDSEWLLM